MKCKHLKRTIPYLHTLLRAKKPCVQKKLLQNFPAFVSKDILEIIVNILQAKCCISGKQRSILQGKKKQVSQLANEIQKSKQRITRAQKLLPNQTGGFLSAILPIVSSVLAGIVGASV